MKRAVRANFDASASEYTRYEAESGRFADLARRLAAVMTERAGRPLRVVLDAGAGTGASTRVLAGPDRTVIALDISRAMLAHNDAPVRIQADLDHLPLGSATVDAVAYTASLFLVPDPAVAVAEARRVLRPGGVVGAVAPRGWRRPDGTDVFADLDRESRSPVATGAVRSAVEAVFETATGTWAFEATAADLEGWHRVPAMAARLYPHTDPADRPAKVSALLGSVEGPLEQRWQWIVGRAPMK